MIITGYDFHARFQQIAMLETETGEYTRRRLEHGNGEAREFYAALRGPALVGIESSGYARWFVEMLEELGHQGVVGDAAQIRARAVRFDDLVNFGHEAVGLLQGDDDALVMEDVLAGENTTLVGFQADNTLRALGRGAAAIRAQEPGMATTARRTLSALRRRSD